MAAVVTWSGLSCAGTAAVAGLARLPSRRTAGGGGAPVTAGTNNILAGQAEQGNTGTHFPTFNTLVLK